MTDRGYRARRDSTLLRLDRVQGRLPDRCVVCARPAGGYRLRRDFSWPPRLLLLLALVPGLVLMLLLKRRALVVLLPLCERHREKRRQAIAFGWAGCAALFVLGTVLVLAGSYDLFLWCLVAMLPVSIVAWHGARVCSVARTDERHVWLRVGAPFLGTLRTNVGGADGGARP